MLFYALRRIVLVVPVLIGLSLLVFAVARLLPGDPIQLVQGVPGGPHGADPDRMPGVVRLETGRYDDGRPMAGPSAHTDVLDERASDSWRNVLAVVTGDRSGLLLAE